MSSHIFISFYNMPSTMEVPVPSICHLDGGIVMWTALCELSYNCAKLMTRFWLQMRELWLRQIKHHGSPVVVVQSLSYVWLFETPWTAACHASLSFTISRSLLRLMSTESVMPSNHLILCCPLLLLPSIFPLIRVFSNDGSLHQVAKILEHQL